MRTPNNRQKGRIRGPGGPGPLEEQVQVARVAALVASRSDAGVSLRSLAETIGISKSAVDKLVKAHNGLIEMPRPHKTWGKLRKWYLSEKLVDDGGLQHPVDMALVALEMLAGVPEADRRAAVAELVASLEQIYRRHGTARPAWLSVLARDSGACEETASPPDE